MARGHPEHKVGVLRKLSERLDDQVLGVGTSEGFLKLRERQEGLLPHCEVVVSQEALDQRLEGVLEAFEAQVLEQCRQVLDDAQSEPPLLIELAADDDRDYVSLDVVDAQSLLEVSELLNQPNPDTHCIVLQEGLDDADSGREQLFLLDAAEELDYRLHERLPDMLRSVLGEDFQDRQEGRSVLCWGQLRSQLVEVEDGNRANLVFGVFKQLLERLHDILAQGFLLDVVENSHPGLDQGVADSPGLLVVVDDFDVLDELVGHLLLLEEAAHDREYFQGLDAYDVDAVLDELLPYLKDLGPSYVFGHHLDVRLHIFGEAASHHGNILVECKLAEDRSQVDLDVGLHVRVANRDESADRDPAGVRLLCCHLFD